MSADDKNGKNPGQEEQEKGDENEKGGRTLYRTLFPVQPHIWQEARRLAGDRNVRVEDLAICAGQDPILVIELLKVANAMFFSGGRQTITSIKTAIIRLGSDVLIDTLNDLAERPQITDERMAFWFETHRSRCRRASIVARMLAEILAKNLADDCQAAALFMFIGEMLAVTHLEGAYTQLADEMPRANLNYRISQTMRFDVERATVTYLQRQGIPESLAFAVDRDSSAKAKERAIMKPICFAASELVEAFELNKWEKLAPGKVLPSKSSIRILPLSESQYLKVYERATEFLYADKLMEEKRRQQLALNPIVDLKALAEGKTGAAPAAAPAEDAGSLNSLDDEINSLLESVQRPAEKEPAPNTPQKPKAPPVAPSAPPKVGPPPTAPVKAAPAAAATTTIREMPKLTLDPTDQFSLGESRDKVRVVRQSSPPPLRKEPPQLVSKRGAQVVSNISTMFESAGTSEELLASLLAMLVDSGPFEKSALIVVSKNKETAIVVAARGPTIGTGQRLDLNDPLNPLAQCFSKVQSFGNKESELSPFGSKSFALAPINADHETPVALYADCGNDRAITFEARRVFRTVVEILNEKLPQIPGGIPVELA